MKTPEWFLFVVDYQLGLIKDFWHGPLGGIFFYTISILLIASFIWLVKVWQKNM